jgi:hypothetical protein
MIIKKPNSNTPWNSVILAIDPGKISGVAIYVNGAKLGSGIIPDNKDDIEQPVLWEGYDWTRQAGECAQINKIPLIVVIESHVIHGKWSAQAMAGTAESVGVWKHYIEQLPELKWKPKILRVPVDEWRKGIYGTCRAPKTKQFTKHNRKIIVDTRDYWKHRACITAGVEDNDEAEAILIGRYASKWWKVGECAGVKPCE